MSPPVLNGHTGWKPTWTASLSWPHLADSPGLQTHAEELYLLCVWSSSNAKTWERVSNITCFYTSTHLASHCVKWASLSDLWFLKVPETVWHRCLYFNVKETGEVGVTDTAGQSKRCFVWRPLRPLGVTPNVFVAATTKSSFAHLIWFILADMSTTLSTD